MINVLFLDIDGVLNDHKFNKKCLSSRILPRCRKQLNKILKKTDARIVLISAWRYMILEGAMTLSGFEYLLRTHWINVKQGYLIGTTRRDWEPYAKPSIERSIQVQEWLLQHQGISQYVIVDDNDYGYTNAGVNFIRIDGKIGMMEDDADKVIDFFKRM